MFIRKLLEKKIALRMIVSYSIIIWMDLFMKVYMSISNFQQTYDS